MRKLALILVLLPFFMYLHAENEKIDFSQFELGKTKKELTKQLKKTDKTFNFDQHKIAIEDVKKSGNQLLTTAKITAYALGGNQFVFDNDRLAQVGMVGSKYANDTLRFAALDSLKANEIIRLGEPLRVSANAVVWLTDAELYAISTRESRIYITRVKREWISDAAVADIQSLRFKYYDASKFDLTLGDISGFKNKMSRSEFEQVFKKKISDRDSFRLEDYLDPDNQFADRGYTKYSIGDTKAMFINDVMLLVSGFARPSLTEEEKDELINNIISVSGPPRVVSNRHTWRNKTEGLDLIFENDIDQRYNMIFIIGVANFFKD